MSAKSAPRLTDKQAEDILEVLDKADEYHRSWLHDLHGSLICAVPFAEDVTTENSHTLCRFGKWYRGDAPAWLREDPQFIELDRYHRMMHDSARRLACEYQAGAPIPVSLYAEFIEHQTHMSVCMERIRDRLQELRFSFDTLTGALNREAFLPVIQQEYARLQRTGESCAIAMVDLDYFKKINDTHGHLAGDRVLRWVSRRLFRGLRKYDSVCRYGGEEFLVFLPHVAGLQAVEILDRMRQVLEHTPVKLEVGNIQVTASFGVSMLLPDRSIQQSIARADQALYQAKEQGRNRVCFLD